MPPSSRSEVLLREVGGGRRTAAVVAAAAGGGRQEGVGRSFIIQPSRADATGLVDATVQRKIDYAQVRVGLTRSAGLDRNPIITINGKQVEVPLAPRKNPTASWASYRHPVTANPR